MGGLTKKPCPGNCGDIRERYADELCWNCKEALRKWREQEEHKKKEDEDIFEIGGEKIYPIWNIQARWLEDITEVYEPSPWQVKDTPEGRMWNSTSHNKMFKEEKKPGEVMIFAYEWLRRMLSKEKYTKVHSSNPIVCIRFMCREVWCLTWFSHYTFDTGQTNQEVLRSFHNYVERTQQINAREGKKVDGFWRESYCLMGAEDRWRWCGSGNDGNPTCRCKQCTELGVIRIDH